MCPVLMVVAASERELSGASGAIALCCGIGPVEAALRSAQALTEQRPSAILHVGIAGATTLKPGSVVVGSESIYCDVLDPHATLPRVTSVEPSPELVAIARGTLPDAAVLPIATAARVGGGAGYEVEAMEGFGVLRAAALAGVPALEVRVISNSPIEPDRARWRIDDALEALRATVEALAPAMLSAAGSN
jgi:futalosine hydrolase